uniref:Matrix metallopeptidase 20a (enamelysin) n=1 Tax=Seriola lalandi dorsalis TaxID=1841481 RepID=A0A3B4X5B4_SERLL
MVALRAQRAAAEENFDKTCAENTHNTTTHTNELQVAQTTMCVFPEDTKTLRRIRSTSAMEEKIREMQNFFGLTETGHLDPHTLDVMREPRCGVPDVENFSFYPEKPKWKNHTITYMIAKYTPDMKNGDVAKSFFTMPLKIHSTLMLIMVNHAKKDGEDGIFLQQYFSPFDGPCGELAHAFQPGEGMGGDVHFDEDETWTAGGQGYSLFAVAAHEFGHSLGLTHSKDPSAIMYPNYRHHSSTQYSLSRDDVLGIQKSPEGRSGTYLPSISFHVDAAYDIPAKGVAYIFTGRVMGSLSCAGSIYEYGFSSRIRQVDAAVHVSEYGKTVFFTGDFYYSYPFLKRRMDPGFPRLIQTDWPGIPKRVNAAFNIFLLSGLKSCQFHFRQKRVVNIIPANSWLGCRYS